MSEATKKLEYLMKAEFFHYEIIDSTHEFARRHLTTFNPAVFSIIYADQQTAGRGQLDRSWISDCPGNIYASFVFFLPLNTSYLASLGQALALSVVNVLQELPICLKWPNDLFLQGKKLGGVLCDIITIAEHTACIASLGLNVNMPPSSLDNLPIPATSLLQATHSPWDVVLLLEKIQLEFVTQLATLQSQGSLALQENLAKKLLYKGEIITFEAGNTCHRGKFIGIDSTGALLLESAQGLLRFYSGRIQVRLETRRTHREKD